MKAPTASDRSEELLNRFERFGQILDRRMLDPLLGLLLPGVGDVLGSLLGLYGVITALRIKAHPVVIARMLVNLALDALIGAVPIAGAVGDFLFRANLRNARLLRTRRARSVRPMDTAVVGAALLVFLGALILPLLLTAWLLAELARRFS